MKKFFIVLIAVALIVSVVLISGLRIFVIKPIGAVPDGVTAIVVGVPKLRFIDSPDAFCIREVGYVNLLCRGGTAAGVAKNGQIIARLPYSSMLDWLAGTPDTDR